MEVELKKRVWKNTKEHDESTEEQEVRLARIRQYNKSKTPNMATEQRDARIVKEQGPWSALKIGGGG